MFRFAPITSHTLSYITAVINKGLINLAERHLLHKDITAKLLIKLNGKLKNYKKKLCKA